MGAQEWELNDPIHCMYKYICNTVRRGFFHLLTLASDELNVTAVKKFMMCFFSQLETAGCETVLCMWSHTQVVMCCIMCVKFFNHYPLLIIHSQHQNKPFSGFLHHPCTLLFIEGQIVGAIYCYRCDFNELHNSLSGRKKEKMNEKQSCPFLRRLSCG